MIPNRLYTFSTGSKPPNTIDVQRQRYIRMLVADGQGVLVFLMYQMSVFPPIFAASAVVSRGPVNCLRVFNGALWVGGQQGITCFDLESLQARGTIASQHPITGRLSADFFLTLATLMQMDRPRLLCKTGSSRGTFHGILMNVSQRRSPQEYCETCSSRGQDYCSLRIS